MITYIDKVTELVAERTQLNNDDLVHLYALLVLVRGLDITLNDVHDAWAMNMNFKAKSDQCSGHGHPCIVPFKELSREEQEKDRHFADILRAIAAEIQSAN